jgi:hypothetical protein
MKRDIQGRTTISEKTMQANTTVHHTGLGQIARRTLITGLLAVSFGTAQAADPVAIDIAAQPLASAMAAFAEQSGVRTVVPAELLPARPRRASKAGSRRSRRWRNCWPAAGCVFSSFPPIRCRSRRSRRHREGRLRA